MKYWRFWYHWGSFKLPSLPGVVRKGVTSLLLGAKLNRGIGATGSRRSEGWAGAGAALVALAFGGCNARERVEHKVWNLFAINPALAEGRSVAAGPTLPGGIPASDLLTQNTSGAVTLKTQRAFAESKPAAS